MSEHDTSHDAKDSETNPGTNSGMNSGANSETNGALDHGAGISIVPGIDNEFGDDCAPAKDSETKDVVLHRPSSSWEDIVFGESRLFEETGLKPSPTRHALSIVSIVAIAAAMGALSGAGTTWGVGYFAKKDQAKDQSRMELASRDRSINDAISQISSELQALKANADSTAKTNATKLAKLGEALEKMKTPAPEVTGSIPAPSGAAPLPAPKPAPAAPQAVQMPVVDGWVLREVADGAALIEGRSGLFAVYAGDVLPGVGRIEGIRRQDGRWVVMTSRGLIVAH